MGKSAIVCVALAALAGCEMPAPPPPPAYTCTKSHTEIDAGTAIATHLLTGSSLLSYAASTKTVCEAWSDGEQHPEDNQ